MAELTRSEVQAMIQAELRGAGIRVRQLQEAAAGFQPLNDELTAIAALNTDAFGRGLLELASDGAVRTYIGIGRLVSGGVTSAGAVADGSGFSAAKNSTGNYTVTYGSAFSATPAVVVTGQTTAPLARLSARSATAFTVETFTTAGGNVDSAFSFIAYRI